MAAHLHEFTVLMGLNTVKLVEPLNLLLQFSLNRDDKNIELNVGAGYTAE